MHVQNSKLEKTNTAMAIQAIPCPTALESHLINSRIVYSSILVRHVPPCSSPTPKFTTEPYIFAVHIQAGCLWTILPIGYALLPSRHKMTGQ